MKGLKIIVTGKVQGVFYRANAREIATALGLIGWVRNLSSGGVEIEALGQSEKLEEFLTWCKEGPPHARVEHLNHEWFDDTGISNSDKTSRRSFLVKPDF